MKKTSNTLVNNNHKDKMSNIGGLFKLLKNMGDNLSACITKTNRKVLKVETNDGNSKYSVTQYPNGTIVETKTTKNK